jgi:3D (Asp-Asp-Asp) domain-containing protein
MNEKIDMAIVGLGTVVFLLAVGCVILAVRLKDTQVYLRELREELREQGEGLTDRINMVNEDLILHSQTIAEFDSNLSEIRSVQRNTNHALNRLRNGLTQAPKSEEKEEVTQSDTKESEEPQRASDKATEGNMRSIGWYELTAYEATGSPCANGNYPTVGYTVACNSLPLGTRIHIAGYGDYVVEDTGGMGGGVIDIYLGDSASCIQFGRQSAEVFIYE